jgi:glutamate formiminotransferase / 5-formyltetrahydrofolate cyclo-ligase
VTLPLESVPNFSEGRDPDALDRLREAMASPATLLDVHVDPDHHRSVYTLVGVEDTLVESLVRGVEAGLESIDLRRHQGAHPRIGAADVVPLVPIRPEDEPRARAAALALADRIAALGVPVFFYGRLTDGAAALRASKSAWTPARLRRTAALTGFTRRRAESCSECAGR